MLDTAIKKLESSMLLIIILAAVAVYASFSAGLPQRFNSPDEMANAYFSLRLAQGQPITEPAPLNQVADNNIVHPRSTVVVNGQMAPASFLGLPLIFGFIGRVLGQSTLPYLSPLFAIVGLLAIYLFVRELSGWRAAVIAIILVASLPAYWYYHARSFFHNALFFDLLALQFYLSLKVLKPGWVWQYIAAGLVFGLAISVRASEIFWLSAMWFIWLILNRKALRIGPLILSGVSAIVAFLPVLLVNKQIYGQYLSVGYRTGLDLWGVNLNESLSLLRELIIPFGINAAHIWQNVNHYLIKLQWWWAVLAIIGLAFSFYHWFKLTRVAQSYLVMWLLASGWLIVLYGSWLFHDNPDPSAVTLGTAYMRYWLPVLVWLLSPAAQGLAWWWQKRWGKTLVAAVLGVFIFLSWQLVMTESQEGLIKIKQNIKRFENASLQVQAVTPADAVIVTGITDKFFFPERQVMVDLYNERDLESVGRLLRAQVPVYNFHITWPAADFDYYNNQLAEHNLSLEPVLQPIGEHSLYQYHLVNL